MFQIEHPDDFLFRFDQDRRRIEERNRLMRALRGSAPPFSEATEARLRLVMRDQLHAQTEAGR
jgi:hypothetical protein